MSKYLNQLMIALMLALLTAVYYWAKETTLDLITRGEGRLIAEGQNKLVQSPEGGVVTDIFVSDGDKVQTGQLLALINSTEAEGSLEEINAKKNKSLVFSKWKAMDMVGRLINLRNKKHEVVDALAAYAMSESKDSGPYVIAK